jgi:flagellar basal-body rod modification protein FlgD
VSELIQKITNGVVDEPKKNSTSKSKASNALGKDAFLQLLATQMKYQDPMNPNTDTEYVAQLATFSQLEQLQNLSKTSDNSLAYGLVGKNVRLNIKNSDTGDVQQKDGPVDFVSMSDGEAKLSVDGNLYSMDQLETVFDPVYILQKGLPGIKDKTELVYDAQNPDNVSFKVNLGEGETVADKVAVAINNTKLDDKLITLSGNKVTIDKSAFIGYKDGTYPVQVVFNDPLYTTDKEKVTLKVINAAER